MNLQFWKKKTVAEPAPVDYVKELHDIIDTGNPEQLDSWTRENNFGRYSDPMRDALHYAAQKDKPDIIQYLVSDLEMNINSWYHQHDRNNEKIRISPLADAVKYQSPLATRKLIALGADVDDKNLTLREKPLYFAVINGDTGMVNLLIQSGAKPDRAMISSGQDAIEHLVTSESYLSLSMLGGQNDVTLALLKAGAKPYGISETLRRAAHPDIQGPLKKSYDDLYKKAEPHWKILTEKTGAKVPLEWPDNQPIYLMLDHHVAAHSLSLPAAANDTGSASDPKIQAAFINALRSGQINNIKRGLGLVDKGITLNPPPNEDQPLMVAIQHAQGDDTRIVDMLVKAGANIENMNGEGQTPLIVAAQNGKTSIVSYLLDAGAHPHTLDNHGKNALHYAVKERHQDTARTLLTGKNPIGADTPTQFFETPLDIAIENHDQGMVNLLQQHGATQISEETKKWANLEFGPAPQNTPTKARAI